MHRVWETDTYITTLLSSPDGRRDYLRTKGLIKEEVIKVKISLIGLIYKLDILTSPENILKSFLSL